MTLEIGTIINMGASLLIVSGAFFKLKNTSDKNYAFIKKNTKYIEQMDTEIKNLKTATTTSLDNIHELINENMDKQNTKRLAAITKLDEKLQSETKMITSEINEIKNTTLDTLNEKLNKTYANVLERIEKIYNKLDTIRDALQDNEHDTIEVINEVKSISKYELSHIKKDLDRLENLIFKIENKIHESNN